MFLYALAAEEENNGEAVNSSSNQKKAYYDASTFLLMPALNKKIIKREISNSIISKPTLLFSRVSSRLAAGEKKEPVHTFISDII